MEHKLMYKCVNCGEAAPALYRTYGPSVLKLTKCENCKGIVDKYIEYDPVIVMIDLVLISKEAQRHIIYNTEFKSYWKLVIILMILETYGVWRNESLFNIVVNTVCDIRTNSTLNTTYLDLPYKFDLPEPWKSACKGWAQDEREGVDLFIWEKDFYIQFMSIFVGTVVFVSTIHIMMRLMKTFTVQNEVSRRRAVRALAAGYGGSLGALPALVWGAAAAPPTRALHALLVLVYGCVVYYNTLTATPLSVPVLYGGPKPAAWLALGAGHCAKHVATFHLTPLIRRLLYQ